MKKTCPPIRCTLLSSLLVLSLLLATQACGPSSGGGNTNHDATNDGGGGSDGDGGGGGGGGGAIVDAAVPFPDASCGAQMEEIPLVNLGDPPDLLIVLDKSGSMNIGPNPFMPLGPTKWNIMKDAIANVTSQYENNIRFGLTAFPNGSNVCDVGTGAEVGIGLANATPINSWMNANGPGGNTPAQYALQNAAGIYAGIPANTAGQFVLFATDGSPNCGGDPIVPATDSATATVAAVAALKAQGVDTFVLGFGSTFGFGSILNDAAVAGGQPRSSGPPYFYEANDAASLEAVLLSIAGGIIVPSCSFTVTQTPPDPDRVTVTINGAAIPRDGNHNDGWDYYPDASTITFFGSACTQVEAGSANVSFVFGCPGPIVD